MRRRGLESGDKRVSPRAPAGRRWRALREARRSADARTSARGFAALLGAFAVLTITVGWFGDRSRAERHLIDKLRDQNPSTRAVAAFQLSRERHPSLATVDALTGLLDERDDEARGEAVAALISIGGHDSVLGGAVVRSMTSILSAPSRPSIGRLEAVHVLGQLGAMSQPAIHALALALQSTNDSLRSAAAAALGQVGVPDETLLRALATALEDSVADVRAAALESLARLRPDDATSQIASRLVIRDPSSLVRLTAVYALMAAGRHDTRTATTLEMALRDTLPEIRRAAAQALLAIGVQRPSAPPFR